MESLFKIVFGVIAGLFAALVGGAVLMLVAIPMAALDGWILHLAWSWFVVPTFHVAELAWAMATGIVLLVAWLVLQPSVARSEKGATSILVMGGASSLIAWFLMWGVHEWIIH